MRAFAVKQGRIKTVDVTYEGGSRSTVREVSGLAVRTHGGKFTVKLSNLGNPDFRQDSSRPLPGCPCCLAHVDSLREARDICRAYISFFDLGGGNWTGGEIVRADGLVIGRVSYNGRVWEPGEWTPRLKEIAI